MKIITKSAALLLALGVSALVANAQEDGGPPQGGPPGGGPGHFGHRPPPAIIAILDTNHDGIIDSNEIANASAALSALAAENGGQLTVRELMRPQRFHGTNNYAGGPPGGRADGRRRPEPPLFAALDTNHDGVIDSNEIANASAVLSALAAKDGGQLTLEDLRPPRPQWRGSSNGGPGDFGPPPDGADGPPPDGNGPPPQDGQGGPPPQNGQQGPPPQNGGSPPGQ